MKKLTYLIFFVAICLFESCKGENEEHFISDAQTLARAKEALQTKQEVLKVGDRLSILGSKKLTTYEREALTWLYAYMPLSDIIDHTGEYFLEQVKLTHDVLQTMPWGKQVDEQLVRHFVLPIRVNNEPLDEARGIFLSELKKRVAGLSMSEAALEVNHWCHEKMVYTPSDGRTSSPLQSLRTAYGRCGEESTFCVAAMRAVGIPARQVYVPRWAHIDDNHAWVEVWTDGKWHFLGACEPEAVLDLAWFNIPASRSMLMHTKVFGDYEGEEEVVEHAPNYTEINVVGNYAPTSKIELTIKDKQGKAVKGAKVEYKLYNYAEFYTVARKLSDAEGHSSLTTGQGDLMVLASKDGYWGFTKIDVRKNAEATVVLDKSSETEMILETDIVPPSVHYNLPAITEEQRNQNDRRLANEDSIRAIYVSTMMTPASAQAWMKTNGFESQGLDDILVKSRGNATTLQSFMIHASDKHVAMKLLQSLSAKDLRDIPLEILNDNLRNTAHPANIEESTFVQNVLCPRVEIEALTPYKQYFQQTIPVVEQEQFRKDPAALVRWCRAHVQLNNELNTSGIPISPQGVYECKVADERSLGIFFVAVCRSLGIPAWKDAVTGKILYRNDGNDCQAIFDEHVSFTASPKGLLIADYDSKEGGIENPLYYTHFTISHFENGSFHLLEYEEGDADMENGSSYEQLLKHGLSLDAGYYVLVSGTRMKDGSVLTNSVFFHIEPEKTTRVSLVLRRPKQTTEILGVFDTSLLSSIGIAHKPDAYTILGILGVNEEPTNHALRDLATLGRDFDAWSGNLVLLFPSAVMQQEFKTNDFPGLPQHIQWGIDHNRIVQQTLGLTLQLHNASNLPILVVVNPTGQIIFASQGYTIGLGEQIRTLINI